MITVNNNHAATVAQHALRTNRHDLNKSMDQLATGTKINKAEYRPADIGKADELTAQVRGLDQGVGNAITGISLLEAADKMLADKIETLQRMRELAVQAVSDTITATQRSALDSEYQDLEVFFLDNPRVSEWNEIDLLVGTGGSGNGIFNFTDVAGRGSAIQVTIPEWQTNGAPATSSISGMDISDPLNANHLLGTIDVAMGAIEKNRVEVRAAATRLQHTIDNLTNASQQTSAALSQVQDTDYAAATAALARSQIIEQAGTAMLSQANQQPALVSYLLR